MAAVAVELKLQIRGKTNSYGSFAAFGECALRFKSRSWVQTGRRFNSTRHMSHPLAFSYTCMYIHINTHIQYAHTYIHIVTCMHMPLHIDTCIHACVYINICLCIHLKIYIYIYIYIYTCMHTHIYVYV